MDVAAGSSLPFHIFNVTPNDFVATALLAYQHQVQHNEVYREYVQALHKLQRIPAAITDIPFLPISFFKTHAVQAFEGEPEIIFTSSGTTGMQQSRHLVKEVALYEQSFVQGFTNAYGDPSPFAWLCLLPSYMERSGSSLIYMADHFVRHSQHKESGFFLQADEVLIGRLEHCRQQQIPTVLLGVSFALLDFAERHQHIDLSHCIIMDTGGMKGRRKELTRAELHEQLQEAFQVPAIHSEYGMTELLSQAYSKGHGRYHPPAWMKVLVRSEEDPFELHSTGAGLLLVIDLANIHSCCFIETQDVGRVYDDGSFEVLGRMDNSDIRGCSLLLL